MSNDYLEENLPELAESATNQAYWQALASGSSVLVPENGEIRQTLLDGTFKVVKQNPWFVKVSKGQIIKLK